MANYKEIHGVKVQYRDSDATAIEGDVWYNATTGLLKMYAAAGAWSTGGNLSEAKAQGGGAGTQTAAMFTSGRTHGDGSTTANCETYDGSSWTEIANVNTDRYSLGGGGTQTAAFIAGGRTQSPNTHMNSCETWDNSSWTEVGNLTTARTYLGGNGTATAGLIVGGGPPTYAITESWDGSSWSEVNDLNTARIYTGVMGGSATQTAAVAAGGYADPAPMNNSETWNGSAWTEGNNLNTARDGAGASGISTAGVVFGGAIPPTAYTAVTESYNGTSYTEEADMTLSANVRVSAVHGTQTSALGAGGFAPGLVATTEEFSDTASIETISFD